MKYNKNILKIFLSIILVVFLAIIFVNYRSISINNKYLSGEIQKIKEERDSDYFQKKIECEKYITSIKKEVDQNNNFWSLNTSSFLFIFYSPRDNSCLYVTERFPDREFFIFNALTRSKITSFKFPEQHEEYKKFVLDYSDGEIRL